MRHGDGQAQQYFSFRVARWYLGMLFAGGLLIAVSLYAADIYPAFTSAFRHGLFQFVSVVTTTGFATADSNQWTSFAVILLIFGFDHCACRRIHGGRYQDQPAGAGHEDDAHAAAAASKYVILSASTALSRRRRLSIRS